MASTVVVTSIHPPGKAIHGIVEAGYDLIVVGDRKTPADWACGDVTFLAVDMQETLGHRMASELPYNHYGRKMLGYLEAIRRGADVIIDTDDDNIPKVDWGFPRFQGEYLASAPNQGFVNIYSYFSRMRIWPRGLPLERIATPAEIAEVLSLRIGVWQGLADGDPDVDAIYRLVDNAPCFFEDRRPLVLTAGTLTPFNSQNTAFRRELFPLLYLPSYVTFRFTDILRGWVAQPIMWAAGYNLGVVGATVVQERNPHDYTEDFASEIPCYLHGNAVVEAVSRVLAASNSVGENLRQAYAELRRIEIVTAEEVQLLEAWLHDIDAAMSLGADNQPGG